MLRVLGLAVGVTLWGASIFGATHLHRLNLDVGHGICGPWGCAPKPEALLGYHLLLLTIIAPGIALVACWRPPQAAVGMGRLAIGGGVLGLVGLAAWGAATWLADGGGPEYLAQSAGFRIATTPDVPAAQLLIGGVAARLVGWLRGGCCETPRLEPAAGAGET